MGRFIFWLDRRHQQIALNNLRIAYGPGAEEQELKAIARSSYQHLGRSLAELARIMVASPEQVMQMVSTEGWDHFIEAQKKGRGVLLLTAHLGNWELMAHTLPLRGVPIGVVARPVDNPLLEAYLRQFRARWGNRVIDKGGALRQVLKAIRNGEPVGFLLDQNVAPEQGVFVHFFGRPACTHKTLALLALRTGAVVLPVFISRQEDGRHHMVFDPPPPLEETGDLERDIVVNTQRFTAVIESHVRRHPDQWLWVHRRWKTQPPGAEHNAGDEVRG